MDEESVGDPVIHGLHYGYPLCRFTWEKPNDWPNGHVWAPAWKTEEITCVRCKTEAEFLTLQGAQVGT